jgi:hypothetical protein
MPKYLVRTTIVVLIASGWLFIALVSLPQGPTSILGTLVISAVLGTMFGQVSLAAAWCALGPFALVRRLPLAFAWIAAIVLSFGFSIARESNSDGLPMLLVYGGAVLGQWLLVQIPLWLLVARHGLRIVGASPKPANRQLLDQQFGIRQIMILTALVAVVLGAGRILLGGMKSNEPFGDWTKVLIFAFFAVSNAAIAFPLIAAALTRQNLTLRIAGAILLLAPITFFELMIFNWLEPFASPNGEEYWILILINAIQTPWVLSVLLLLRAGGFRLESRHAAVPASSEN